MKKNGFTLIETIIYVALIVFMMGSAVVAAFFVIDSSAKDKGKVNSIVEAEFLMRKIDWVLTGLDLNAPIIIPVPGVNGDSLSVNKNGFASNPLMVDLLSGRARLSKGGGAWTELTSDRIVITNLNFHHIAAIPPKPAAIIASFIIDGRSFQMTKYVRK